jgi:hypothetical protein
MNSHTSEMVITYQKIGELINNPRNSRTHSKRQIRQIADSIKAFGFTSPVLLDCSNTMSRGSWPRSSGHASWPIRGTDDSARESVSCSSSGLRDR